MLETKRRMLRNMYSRRCYPQPAFCDILALFCFSPTAGAWRAHEVTCHPGPTWKGRSPVRSRQALCTACAMRSRASRQAGWPTRAHMACMRVENGPWMYEQCSACAVRFRSPHAHFTDQMHAWYTWPRLACAVIVPCTVYRTPRLQRRTYVYHSRGEREKERSVPFCRTAYV